tara:strand:+ start:29384 stop:32341 length:2958 start_codon:yes stop_codon:yes gene_type:complete
MQADYRSLRLRALGSASNSGSGTANYNWSVAKYQENLSLLSARHESGGLCYIIVENYTTPQQKKLYPTTFDNSADGTNFVERDAKTAYAKFQQYSISGHGSGSSTGVKVQLATSFQDLDSILTSLESFEKPLIQELQRPGVNHMGSQKTALDLRFPEGFIWGKETAYRNAAIYYRSYPKEVRMQALKDMRESVLMDYIEPNVIAEILRANRVVRSAYQMSEYEGSLNNFSSNENETLLPNTPYSRFKITFIDQKGNKIENLPYAVSVKGAINLREAYDRTNAGKDPGNFPSGATLFENDIDSTDGQHQLFRYKINDEIPHRGTFRVQVLVPELHTQSAWSDARLKTYSNTSRGPNDRKGSISPPKSGQVLTNQVFSFTGMGTSHEVRVPIYLEPVPMHLVMNENGQVISKWSTLNKISDLPNHQTVRLRLKISRLKQTALWEQADRNSDGVITQEEYQSTAGEAAREALDFDDKIPVRLMNVEFRPSNENTWLSARDTITTATDLSGVASVVLPPGVYDAFIISQTETGEKTDNKIGTFSVPAGVFFRDTSERDTTPIGAAGVKMIDSSLTIVDYNLKNPIPRLPTGKSAETNTIYAIRSLTAIDKGWPNAAGTASNEEAFDYFEVLLPPLPAEVEIGEAMETIQVEKTTKPSISFNETIEITQESTGPVVLGIDPTPAGTKWKVSRIAVQRGTSPTVQYMGAYDLDSPLDIAGKQRFAVSEIGYKRAYNLTSAEDILVFYPVGNEDIVAYPTNSVEVLSSPEEFTAFIEDVEEETVPIVPGPIQPTPKPVPPIQTGPSSYMGYYYEIADLSNFMGQNRGWAYTLYPPEASNGEYFNYSSVLALQDSFSTSNSAESAVKSYINSLQEAERFQKIANNQATNTTSQLPQAVQNILNSLPTQNASANNNNTGDGLPSTIASMNTDGDGYITWRNGLSNNEIAAKEAAVAEAVAAAEAYAASQEGKAATAAEHERIMREIAAGGVPRL